MTTLNTLATEQNVYIGCCLFRCSVNFIWYESIFLLWSNHSLFGFSSYLHCEWRTVPELEKDKRIQSKIKRYKLKKLQLNSIFDQVRTSYIVLCISIHFKS